MPESKCWLNDVRTLAVDGCVTKLGGGEISEDVACPMLGGRRPSTPESAEAAFVGRGPIAAMSASPSPTWWFFDSVKTPDTTSTGSGETGTSTLVYGSTRTVVRLCDWI